MNKKVPNQTRNKTEITQDRLVFWLPLMLATDLSAVNEILNQAMKIARKVSVKVVCEFDQALHAKVINTLWKYEEKFVQ